MASLALTLAHPLRGFALELSLAVGAEVVALAGPSGAGKTTVLRCVAGLVRPARGSVRCGEATWLDTDAGVDLAPEARSVGYVPQHHALFPHLTVAENVAFGGASGAEVAALLDRLGISALARARPGELSGGERQRVALARALGRRPEVLLLDEPLAALDAATRRRVRDELADVLRDLAIPTVLVTHDVADAAVLADRVAVLVDGAVRQLGTPRELAATPADPFVVELSGGRVLTGQAHGRTVALDGGGEVRVAREAHGAVRVGIFPWDLEVRPGAAPAGTLPGIARALVVEGGRVRVRTAGWTGDARLADGIAPGDAVYARALRGHLV